MRCSISLLCGLRVEGREGSCQTDTLCDDIGTLLRQFPCLVLLSTSLELPYFVLKLALRCRERLPVLINLQDNDPVAAGQLDTFAMDQAASVGAVLSLRAAGLIETTFWVSA